MIGRRCNRNSEGAFIPPDVKNPPEYIPLRSLDGRYQVLEELGNGSFGCVSLAKAELELSRINESCEKGFGDRLFHKTLLNQDGMEHENFFSKSQGLVAIKTMMSKLPTLHDYTRVREIKFILSIPAHKNLIQIFEIFIDSENYQLHIVMECMEQNLYQMMRHRRRRVFSIPSLKSILAQILCGLKHIHDNSFFHRDLKPENILISASTRYFDKKWINDGNYTDNYIVKLADFGLARNVENKNPYTAYVSTRWYRSPEILLRSGFYSKPLDIWAFGCVAVEVTTFKPLFPGSTEMDQIWKILEVLGTPHRVNQSKISNDNVPQGGFWEEAKNFAERLNMKFPYIDGLGLDSLISSSQLKSLTDVVKCCLRWDPNQRANIDQICSMPFFYNTILDKRVLENENIKPGNDLEEANLFAKVKSSVSSKKNSLNQSRKLIFHSENLWKEHQECYLNEKNDQDYIMNKDPKEMKGNVSLSEFERLIDIDNNDHLKKDHDEGINISREIADNIALCQMPVFENGQFLPQTDIDFDVNDKSLRNLANEINNFDDPNHIDSFSQFYSATTNSNDIVDPITIPIDSNYIHHHYHSKKKNYNDHDNDNDQNDIHNITIENGGNSELGSVQPVNKLLDSMSIGDSFCTNNRYINIIPRSFLLKEQMVKGSNEQTLDLEKHTIEYPQQHNHQNESLNEPSNYDPNHEEPPYFGSITF